MEKFVTARNSLCTCPCASTCHASPPRTPTSIHTKPEAAIKDAQGGAFMDSCFLRLTLTALGQRGRFGRRALATRARASSAEGGGVRPRPMKREASQGTDGACEALLAEQAHVEVRVRLHVLVVHRPYVYHSPRRVKTTRDFCREILK